MVDIEKHLVPRIRERWGDPPIEEAEGTEYKAIFRCIHPGVGDIFVSDERDEITIFLGNFTHMHFDALTISNEYESPDDYAAKISDEAIFFLEDVFADEIEFWGNGDGLGGCRTRRRKPRGAIRRFLSPAPHYVWSGPLEE
jgi:hypothetical protein